MVLGFAYLPGTLSQSESRIGDYIRRYTSSIGVKLGIRDNGKGNGSYDLPQKSGTSAQAPKAGLKLLPSLHWVGPWDIQHFP